MRDYCQKRIRYVADKDDFNWILSTACKYSILRFGDFKENTRDDSFLRIGQRYLKFTCRYIEDYEEEGKTKYRLTENKQVTTWIFDMTGKNDITISPSSVIKKANAVYKPYDIIEAEKKLPEEKRIFRRDSFGKIMLSASPYIGYNPKYDNTENYIYIYDLNSAYGSVLRDKIIDTYHWREEDIVGENEVGFILGRGLPMVHKGYYADFVFPLIDSPYKDFVDKYYSQKKMAMKGSKEYNEAKAMQNILVGLFQNHNPFLRAYIVNSCNERIESIIKSHKKVITLWNTDAVYSKEPLDLPIGDDIGQFKLEYEGVFRQKGLNYQKVDKHETSYRGICKESIADDYNILTDDVPRGELPFKYDKSTNTVKESNK